MSVICKGFCVQHMCLVRSYMSHELVLHLCFFSSMNWQGHEVWIQVLLSVLMGQRGLGRAGLGGIAPVSCLTYSWVWWEIYTQAQRGVLLR